jgi:hypothetical protein
MEFKYLPIGSIVVSKDFKDKEFMICAYIDKNKKINDTNYDYACCLYPIGITKECFFLKNSDVSEIVFIGYQGPKYKMFINEIDGDKNE